MQEKQRSATRQGYFLAASTIFISALVITGCNHTVYPIATGFHAPLDQQDTKQKRFVVWSNHAAVGNVIVGMLQQRGQTVIERARLQEVLREQNIRLTHTSEDDSDLLRV